MTGERVQTKVVLSDTLMTTMAVIAASELDDTAKAEASVLLALSAGILKDAAQFDPTSVAIPQRQWTTVAQGLIDAQAKVGSVDAVNASLLWMNYGPSAYEEVL